jgi:hypothetical protein
MTMAVNLNITTTNAASSETDVKRHALLRSYTVTTLLGLISLLACLTLGAPSAAHAASAACPNEPVRESQPHGLLLPDCRAYEQVSPVAKNAQNAEGAPGAVEASSSGGTFSYFSTGPFFGPSGGGCRPTYISSREGTLGGMSTLNGAVNGAWSTMNIRPQAQEAACMAWDENLSQVVEYSEGVTPEGTLLAPGEDYVYMRETAKGIDRHLFTGGSVYYHFWPAGFSAGGSRFFFESPLSLVAGAAAGKVNLYEYDSETGALALAGMVPASGEPACGGSSLVVCEPSSSGSVAGAGADDGAYTKSTVAEDGDVVFFTANGETEAKGQGGSERGGQNGRIYARIDGDETVAVSEGVARYRTAAANGEYVFYEEGGNLYRFDTKTSEREELTGAQGTGETTNGSETVTGVHTATGVFAAGRPITGQGIPSATGAGEVQSGSNVVTGVREETGAFVVGETVTASGYLPGGDVITAVGPGTTLTLSAAAINQSEGGVVLTADTTIATVGSGTPGTLTLSTAATASASGVALATGPPGVLGVVGVSAGGSTLYFAATSVLTGSEKGPDGETAEENVEETNGVANLYVWHQGEGGPAATLFIAKLVGSSKGYDTYDERDWEDTPAPSPSETTFLPRARVTPDGDTLLFEKGEPARHGGEGKVFFRYRAAEGGKPATLLCVTCYPAGSYPAGSPPPVEPAAELSGVGAGLQGGSNRLAVPRNLSENGDRVFFQSGDPLLGETASGVYEWEADGEGSCRSESQDGGCLSLIGPNAYIGDASANGNDVFFFTTQRLGSSDDDELYDVYDAGVDAGACGIEGYKSCPLPEPEERTPCTSAETCKPPPSEPPAESFPATAAFNGPGNLVSPPSVEKPVIKTKTPAQLRAEKLAKALKACEKKPKKQRAKCEMQARRKYGPVKKAKAKGGGKK